MNEIDVIFIAACMSEFAAPAFKKCGAKHVICVEKGKTIEDQVAIKFTKEFYNRMVNGESVCEAFDNAKEDV